MASEWRERSLGELTENFDAIRVPVKESDRKPGPYPYYGASGVVDHVDRFLFDGEYLLIAEDGENLRTRTTPLAFLARGKFWVNNHAHILRGNEKADTRFLMYALAQADISGYLTGSTMPKLTQGNMNRIPLLTPPLPGQRAIAHILGTLDDKIELNHRMNETLEAMAQAIFKSWFVDFDPVKAEAAQWEDGKIAEIASLSRASLNPSSFPDEFFDHYSLPSFDEHRLPHVERGGAIQSNKFVVMPDCILLSKLNPRIPRVWLPAIGKCHRSICSTEFLVVLPQPGVPREWIYGLFNSEKFLEEFSTFVTGTSGSHQRVQPKSLMDMSVVIPPKQVLEKFSAMVGPMYARIIHNLFENRDLAAARDTLLPKLLSGEISPVDDPSTLAQRTR